MVTNCAVIIFVGEARFEAGDWGRSKRIIMGDAWCLALGLDTGVGIVCLALVFDVNVAILLEVGAFKALMIDLLFSLDIGLGIDTAVTVHGAGIVTKAISLLPIIF